MAQITDISKSHLSRAQTISYQMAAGGNPKKEMETLETEIDSFVRNRLSSQPIPSNIKASLDILKGCKASQLSKEWLVEKFTRFRTLNLTRPGAPIMLFLMGTL